MKAVLLLLLLSLAPLTMAEEGGWYNRDGTPAPNTDAMKSSNGFGGWLVVTPDKDWEAKWNTPADHTPQFTDAKDVRYGEELTILLFFINPKPTPDGDIDIRCDITITRPDGTASMNAQDVECAKGKVQGDPRMVRLSTLYIKYIGEAGDPPGKWIVDVVMTDAIRKTLVPLKTHFFLLNETAKPAEAPSPSRAKMEAVGKQMMYFYTAPSQTAFESVQHNVDEVASAIREAGNGADVLTAVFIARIAQKHHWPIAQSAYYDRAQEILAGESDLAKFIDDDTQVNPAKLDVWWVSYFATGEEHYLDRLYHYAGMPLPEKGVEKILIVGAAKWSFKSNCQRHPAIQAFAKRQLGQANAVQRDYLQECLKGNKEN